MRNQLYTLGLLLCTALLNVASSTPTGPGCKIGVLDTQRLAHAAGIQPCSPWDDLAAASATGIVYLRDRLPDRKAAGHHTGQCAGLWFAAEAIYRSSQYTENLEEADVILVDDYCYRTKALAHAHSQTVAEDANQNDAENLAAVYQLIIDHPVWKATQGSKFTFFWMHPTWRWGNETRDQLFNQRFKCDEFRNARFIVTERAELNVCDSYDDKRITMVPYTSYLSGRNPAPADQRDVLLAFKGTCSNWAALKSKTTAGKLMRANAVKYMADPLQKDLQLSCAPGGHDVTLALLRGSKFCLVIPGDTQSTRRLTEIILEGCIPVYMGPPWHTMPWHSDLDYPSFAVFFNVSGNQSLWMDNVTVHQTLSPTKRAVNAQDAQWWVMDDPRARPFVIDTKIDLIVGHLREIASDKQKLSELQLNVAKAANFFRYKAALHQSSPSAVDLIAGHLCKART